MPNKCKFLTAEQAFESLRADAKKCDKNQKSIMLCKKLFGKKHSVLTRVCLRTKLDRHISSSKTDVYFKNLSDLEIEEYVNKMQPLDKAGAYGV